MQVRQTAGHVHRQGQHPAGRRQRRRRMSRVVHGLRTSCTLVLCPLSKRTCKRAHALVGSLLAWRAKTRQERCRCTEQSRKLAVYSCPKPAAAQWKQTGDGNVEGEAKQSAPAPLAVEVYALLLVEHSVEREGQVLRNHRQVGRPHAGAEELDDVGVAQRLKRHHLLPVAVMVQAGAAVEGFNTRRQPGGVVSGCVNTKAEGAARRGARRRIRPG